ncbi:MAG TPA: hypothetical protein VGS41_02100, partial [Chthonomonadales bacterium]|nr:hypothetical protein [Chthonomonadales bacterium]
RAGEAMRLQVSNLRPRPPNENRGILSPRLSGTRAGCAQCTQVNTVDRLFVPGLSTSSMGANARLHVIIFDKHEGDGDLLWRDSGRQASLYRRRGTIKTDAGTVNTSPIRSNNWRA